MLVVDIPLWGFVDGWVHGLYTMSFFVGRSRDWGTSHSVNLSTVVLFFLFVLSCVYVPVPVPVGMCVCE